VDYIVMRASAKECRKQSKALREVVKDGLMDRPTLTAIQNAVAAMELMARELDLRSRQKDKDRWNEIYRCLCRDNRYPSV
jgi:hypothetical protein